MLDPYITICKKTTEVMILDCNMLCTRSYLWSRCECNLPFIIFVNCDFTFENTAQHHWGLSLKIENEINMLHKTYKRLDVPHRLR